MHNSNTVAISSNKRQYKSQAFWLACAILLGFSIAIQPNFAAIIPALLIGYWLAKDPKRSLILLAYSPAYYFPVVSLGIPGIWKDAVLLLLIGSSARHWVSINSPSGIRGPLAFAAIFGAYLLIELLRSPELGTAAAGYRDYMEFLLVFPMALTVIRNKEDAVLVIKHLFQAGVLVSLFGVFEYFGVNRFASTANSLIADDFKTGRIYSTLGYPTSLGAYLFLLITIGISATQARSTEISRRIITILVIFFFITLVASFSRGATVATMVITVLILVFRPGGPARQAIVIIGGVLLTMLAVAMVPNVRVLLGTINLQDAALLERFLIWNEIIHKYFDSNLLFGMGLGIISGAYDSAPRMISDNFIIKIVLELGLVGLGMVISFHTYLLRRFIQPLRLRNGMQRQALIAGIGVILGYFVLAFSMDIGLVFPLNFLYWLSLACLYRYADA